jgi:hypothetical protein
VYYILSFWTKLVSAYGVSTSEEMPFISNIAGTVISTFVDIQLSRVENPVSNEDGLVSEQLDRYIVSCIRILILPVYWMK